MHAHEPVQRDYLRLSAIHITFDSIRILKYSTPRKPNNTISVHNQRVDYRMSLKLLHCLRELGTDDRISEYNEDQTKQAIVLRILSLLGWNCYDVNEVFPEFNVGKGRVDYSLRINGHDKVFVEVKKSTSDLEDHQSQILEYSFRMGVGLAILTNGITWWFYLPLSEGSFEERRKFYAIDIRQQDPADVARRFKDFLSRDNVESGGAIEEARAIYRSQQREYKVKQTIPKAWHAIISEPDELLTDLLVDRTEEMCGYKPGRETIRRFLVNRTTQDSISQLPCSSELEGASHRRQVKQQKDRTRSGYTFKKPSSVLLDGRNYPVKHWSDILVEVCNFAHSIDPAGFEGKVLGIKGLKRPLFGRNPVEMKSPKTIRGTDLYVESNWSAENMVSKCRQIMRLFGFMDSQFEVISSDID
ncbi:MAG: restriction endonuclease subunit R [Candidatus Coatesbacteria bacterium]|nr:restriction endonuclease subunit R [Candidatus Coatesbacteria bacterium]